MVKGIVKHKIFETYISCYWDCICIGYDMDKIKHYINSIKNGDVFFDSTFKLSLTLRETGLLHLIFSILFFVFGNRDLGLYNAIVCVMYFTFTFLIKKEKYLLIMILTVAEVILHGFVTTFIVGLNSGFVFYYFVMLCAASYFVLTWDIYKKKEINTSVYAGVLLIATVIAYLISINFEPSQPLLKGQLMTFSILNIFMSFASITEFLIFLQWDVTHNSNTLTSKNSELDEMANRDTLTKLYNRRFMNQKLDEKLNDLINEGKIFGIIMCDIDNFKRVNDTYGHDVGDDVLVMVADALKKSTRDDDFVSRWGGEEFLIVINGNKRITIDVAERMRKLISETPVVSGKSEINITMTFGVSESIPGYNIDKLIEIADENLYKGKTNGKNRVVS